MDNNPDQGKASDSGGSSDEDNSNNANAPASDTMSAMQPDMPSDMQMPDDNAQPMPPTDSAENQASSMEQGPSHDQHIPYLDHDPSPHGHGYDSYPFFSDHDYHRDHDFKYSGLHGVDAFPEIVYDHDPHHDYFEHHHPPPTTTTTTTTEEPEELEEPEEPEQPRVKKYSYFYLARSLWYIPLYFTVWFTFYVTYLILQSIGRHKVNNTNKILNKINRQHDECHNFHTSPLIEIQNMN